MWLWQDSYNAFAECANTSTGEFMATVSARTPGPLKKLFIFKLFTIYTLST